MNYKRALVETLGSFLLWENIIERRSNMETREVKHKEENVRSVLLLLLLF